MCNLNVTYCMILNSTNHALNAFSRHQPRWANSMSGAPIEASWCDPDGVHWRILSDWRRRIVRLPDAPILANEGVAARMPDRCAMQTVSVNYHPGSLCCMPEYYRFRDVYGDKWPVRILDCELLGFGNPIQ